MSYFQRRQFYALDASEVHIDLVRIGARNIKRCHAAFWAEMMLGDPSVESVGGQVFPRREQPEALAGNYPVNISFFGAD